jgi:chemotaxis protein CheD
MNAIDLTSVININPGDFVFGSSPKHLYSTVLGSCVSLVLWHPQTSFYAMCHYMSPCSPNNTPSINIVNGRYADQILPFFEKQINKNNINPSELEISLIGGATIAETSKLPAHFKIAVRNVEVAEAFISQCGFKLKCQDTGGTRARKVKFDSRTGTVHVIHIVSRSASNE